MQQTERPKTMFERVLEEHRELRESVASLREFCGLPRPDVEAEEAPAWASELAQRLVRFHDQVYRHFHEEESSGFLEELARSFPRVARPVAAMEREHQELLTGLRSLLDAAMLYAENKAPDRPNLRRRTLSVLEGFERHEQEETDLVQRLFTEDIGCVD